MALRLAKAKPVFANQVREEEPWYPHGARACKKLQRATGEQGAAASKHPGGGGGPTHQKSSHEGSRAEQHKQKGKGVN